MTDQFFSRLLTFARQNKSIKFIKNIDDCSVEVELDNGQVDNLSIEEVFNITMPTNER